MTLNAYAILCKATTNQLGFDNDIYLELNENTMRITNGEEIIESKIDHDIWDGHMSGIVTGKGFAVKYEEHYGCIRNVVYTGSISKRRRHVINVDFGDCKGGSTSDDLCRIDF